MSSDDDSDDEPLVDDARNNDSSSDDDESPPPALAPNKKLYVYHAKNYYEVPVLDMEKNPQGEGIARVYLDRPRVVVQSGEQIGQMMANIAGAWPKAEQLIGDKASLVHYFQIVVAQGKLNKDDQTNSRVWYLLFNVEGKESDDMLILRHIPKPIYREMVKIMARDPSMTGSGLNDLKADKDNDKPLSPSLNQSFVKVEPAAAPKTLCVMPEKKKHDKSEESKKPVEEPKKSVSSLWAKPSAEEKSEGKSAKAKKSVVDEKEAAAKPVAQEEAPASVAGKRKDEEGSVTTLYKKKRTSMVEEHDVVVCDASAVVPIEPPIGATRGNFVITWSFS